MLLQGATGTGKDLVANALHRRSGVAGKFVVLNCSAVVETLFESELFGHVRGAFTGADKDKTGLLELATGGTLFLDEIGDMPLGTQAKLLRALQNQEVLPVGSLTPRKINVRIVAATHRNLKAEIASGRFREDLYYRLSMVELHVPALKERREDISPLARGFVQKFSGEFSKPIKGLTPRAMLLLERYDWPGGHHRSHEIPRISDLRHDAHFSGSCNAPCRRRRDVESTQSKTLQGQDHPDERRRLQDHGDGRGNGRGLGALYLWPSSETCEAEDSASDDRDTSEAWRSNVRETEALIDRSGCGREAAHGARSVWDSL